MRPPFTLRVLKAATLGLTVTLIFAAIAFYLMPKIGYALFFAPGAIVLGAIGPLLSPGFSLTMPAEGPGVVQALLMSSAFAIWWLVFSIFAVLAIGKQPAA